PVNECHWIYGKTQGCEESNSSKKASNQFSLAIDQGKCSSPLDAVSLYNDGIELPVDGKSRSLNK
ncbi:hypothetical protein Ancab_002235, partial [Ancistrocladus abbreviatus]